MRLKWDNNGLKAPLARARGYGSAHEGTGHWLAQRMTAVSNFVLIAWLIWAVVHVQGFDYSEITAFLAQPLISLPNGTISAAR